MADDRNAPQEPLFPAPLLVFLCAVAAVLVVGWRSAAVRPADIAAAVRELADGDLDGAEANAMFRRIVGFADAARGPADTWAVAFAALALGDEAAWRRAEPALAADVAARVTPAPERLRFLDLGDPLFGAVRDACLAEAAGDAATAKAKWRQARDVADLTGRALPRTVAAAALARLGG
jgi:hypothetical protein